MPPLPLPLLPPPSPAIASAAGASLSDHLLTSYQRSLLAIAGSQFGRKSFKEGREGVNNLFSQRGGWRRVGVGGRTAGCMMRGRAGSSTGRSRVGGCC